MGANRFARQGIHYHADTVVVVVVVFEASVPKAYSRVALASAGTLSDALVAPSLGYFRS